jgi:hypothetical protein
MFILSQCILHKCSSLTKLETISTYSIILGLIVYSTIYLYILFNNVDYIYIFNKFIIYIVGIDLLLSTFYYSMNASTVDEVSTPLLQENVFESESDDTDTEDFFESAHEDEKDDEMDVDEMDVDDKNEHIIEIGEEVSVQEGSELHKEVLGEQGQLYKENDQFEVNFKPTESLNDTTIEIKEETETLQEHNKVDNVEGKTDENGEVLIKPKKNKKKGRPSKQSVQ